MLGRESKKVGGQSSRGDRTRQPGTCRQRGHVPGGRALEMEGQHPHERAGSSHTDHAPSAAAAPAPCARAGTVTECVKAQDSTDTVSNQHHLGERMPIRRGWQADGGLHSKPPGSKLLTCPQKPAPSDERRKAA